MNQLLTSDIIIAIGERKAQARLSLVATTDIMPGETPDAIARILTYHMLQRIYGDAVAMLKETNRLLEGDVSEACHLLARLRMDLLRGVWVKEPLRWQLLLFDRENVVQDNKLPEAP